MKRNISKRVIAISALKDITGQRFGKLKVLGYDHSEKCKDGKSTRTYWLCKCSCGNTKVVSKIAYAAGIQNHVENVLARMILILMNMVYAQQRLVVNLFSIKMITKK